MKELQKQQQQQQQPRLNVKLLDIIMQQLLSWDVNNASTTTTTTPCKSIVVEKENEQQQQQQQESIGTTNNNNSSSHYDQSFLWRRKGIIDPTLLSSPSITDTTIPTMTPTIRRSINTTTTCNKKDCTNHHHHYNNNNNNNNNKNISTSSNRKKWIIVTVLIILSCNSLYTIIFPKSSLSVVSSSNSTTTCKARRIEYNQNDPYIYIPDTYPTIITNDEEQQDNDEIIRITSDYYIPSTRNEDNDSTTTGDNTMIEIQQQQEQQETELLSTTTIRSSSSSKKSVSTSSPPKPNRTLVILIGSLRGGEAAWESLYRNVLDINNADLALIIGRHRSSIDLNRTTTTKRKQYPFNSTLYNRAKYIWEYYEDNDSVNNFWSTAIDTMVARDPILSQYPKAYQWRTSIMQQTLPHRGLFGGLRSKQQSLWHFIFGTTSTTTTYYTDRPGSGAIIFIFRLWLAEKIKYHQLQKQYYRFIITRSDHYYLCPHDLNTLLPPLPNTTAAATTTGTKDEKSSLSSLSSLESSAASRSLLKKTTKNKTNNKKAAFIWTPNGKSDFGGITDRHVVVTNRYVLDVINILPALFTSIVQDNVIPWYKLFHWNPEELIEYIWTQYYCYDYPTNRNTFPRTMFTVGIDGDTTRWQKYGRAVNVSDLLLSSSTKNNDNNKDNIDTTTEHRTVRLKYTTEYPETIENCARL